jgi:uncharacterized repeat protein (TIGR01451 family)
MKTDPLGTVSFRYGTGSGSNNGTGPLDAGSTFAPDGTITLLVAQSKISPAQGGMLAPGKKLTGFLTRIRLETGTGGALTPDNAPDSLAPTGEYVLSGNAFCSNRAPTAALTATPTSGSTPLTVNFNGSSSSDPDAGDTIASYNFRFGDGSTPASQTTPTVSHVYSSPGTYHVTMTVTDSRGLTSSNTAAVDITASSPSADLAVVKTGPDTGKVGQALTYVIKATNGGPNAANGVVVTDTLPKNAGFGSVSTSQGTCGPKPQQQVVTCNIGLLASGATATVTLIIKPTTKGDFTDTARVSGTGPNDPVSGNNTSSVKTLVSK